MNNRFAFALFCATARRKGMLRLCLALCALGLVLSVNAQAQGTIITFDAPGAGTVNSPTCAPFCGTVAYANNDLGLIVGSYTDANIVPHGFLREPNGHITSFDAPGAGLGAGLDQGTVAFAISDRGVIVGQYQDSNFVFHGFVRHPDSLFNTFDAPNAGTGANQGTLAWDINPAGTTAGTYIDGSGVYHGFVRSPRGKFTSFDPPGSILTYPCEETCLSPDGTITGFYLDSTDTYHGFVRTPDGQITTIDAPGAGTGGYLGTLAASIAAGAITGYFIDENDIVHGFLRAADCTFTTIDVPGAGPFGTAPYSLNASQWITGVYIDANNAGHGFTRFPNGSFVTFDAPGASTSGAPNGTRPSTNNQKGEVAGRFRVAGSMLVSRLSIWRRVRRLHFWKCVSTEA
jgi:hypothetical protein